MEVLHLAITLEEQLEQYYLEQAKLHEKQGLAAVFRLLAKEERRHAELLQKHAQKLQGLTLEKSNIVEDVKSIFKDLAPMRSEITIEPSQIEAYQFAQLKEIDSIKAYEKLRDQSDDAAEREVFDFLVTEEKKHYSILDAIIEFASRPEEWIEDAEFGLRQDY